MTDKKDEKKPETTEYKATERESATEPIVAPDGHVVLSQEDIDARE